MAGSLVLPRTRGTLSLSHQARICGTLAKVPGGSFFNVCIIIPNQGGILKVGEGAIVIFSVTDMAECLGDQVPVADHHPLGRARGPGGEGEDGGMGRRVDRWRGGRRAGGEKGVEGQLAAQSFAICWF